MLSRKLPEQIRSVDEFEAWYHSQILPAVQVATARVLHEVTYALTTHRCQIQEGENSHRQVWHIFPQGEGEMTKSVSSLQSKIGRELCQREDEGRLIKGELSGDQVTLMVLDFPDLGRFRIVCDFSSDVLQILEVLIHDEQERLLGRYPIRGQVKDYVFNLDLRHPGRGHRARQFAVRVDDDAQEPGPPIHVEIQLMTRLQHDWDQRNHPMYEWTREGGRLPDELVINDVALAETLHLVDEQAARNWRYFLSHREADEGRQA